MNRSQNIAKPENFSQVCVWPGKILKPCDYSTFKKYMLEEFNTKVEVLESIKTFPDRDDNGKTIEGTGNRTDLIFCVHDDDVPHFAIHKLSLGIKWIEDAVAKINDEDGNLYPDRIKEYCTWSYDEDTN